MKKKNPDKKFEEEYFKGWYKNVVGDFTHKDLAQSKKWFWAWLKKLEKHTPLDPSSKKQVLEIGCSIGGVTSLLVEKGYEVWATDISQYAVTNAKKLTPRAHFFVSDIQKPLPLKKKFDLIISFEVVEHLEKPELAIKNMYNALKPEGTLVISTPYPYDWNFRDKTHINVRYPEEWVTIMRSIGLKKVLYHRFTLLPFIYKIHKRLQIIIPFKIANKHLNSPIFFIGNK